MPDGCQHLDIQTVDGVTNCKGCGAERLRAGFWFKPGAFSKSNGEPMRMPPPEIEPVATATPPEMAPPRASPAIAVPPTAAPRVAWPSSAALPPPPNFAPPPTAPPPAPVLQPPQFQAQPIQSQPLQPSQFQTPHFQARAFEAPPLEPPQFQPPPANQLQWAPETGSRKGPRMALRAGLVGVLIIALTALGLYAGPLKGALPFASKPQPLNILLTASQLASQQSFKYDGTSHITMSFTGGAASLSSLLNNQAVAVNIQGNVENAKRSDITETVQLGSLSVKVLAVVYDGSVYISSDGGQTYQSMTVTSQLQDQYGPGNALQYLQSLGATVTDKGAATVDGKSVEQYQASLDMSKLMDKAKAELSGLNSTGSSSSTSAMTSGLLTHMKLSGGQFTFSIDSTGHLVEESGGYSANIDLGAFSNSLCSGLAGMSTGTGSSCGSDASNLSGTMSYNINIDLHMHDYGAPITVQVPPSATSLPTA